MTHILPRAGAALAGLVAAASLSVPAAGCGAKIPDHAGYKNAKEQGWKRPAIVKLDEDLEAEVDSDVSYPKRRRARWFAVDLPGDGELEVRLEVTPAGAGGDDDAEDAEFDLAFEVLDKGFRMLTRADREEQDAGERKKSRTLIELPQGRYYIHVYTQERLDAAEFTLRLRYRSGTVEPVTNFPDEVAFVDPLPVVPAFDDAPAPTAKPRKPRCRGRGCARRPRPQPRPTPQPDPPAEAGASWVPVRIIGVRSTGGGSRITINRGSSQGVAEGWRGQVVDARGKAIPNGDFRIQSVRPGESYASVAASADTVSSAGRARIKAP